MNTPTFDRYTVRDTDILMQHAGAGPDAAVGASGEEKYILRIRDLPNEDKPREKMIKHGPAALSTGELIAVLLNTGTRREGVLAMSNRLLKEYGEKAILHESNPKVFADALGIPLIKACQMIACFELGKRFFKSSAGKPVVIRTAREAYEHLKDMRELPKEHLRGLYLNNHYRLVHDEVISIGSLTANIVHPREVFAPAVEHGASALIIAHNHPSGIGKPSSEDMRITEQLIEAGRILGIPLLDHIIITKKSFTSIPVKYQ